MLNNENKTVDEILAERARHYGSYQNGVAVRATIVEAMVSKYIETRDVEAEKEKIELMRIMFSDLALKLMRFAATPQYADSLQDLQGYAKLINDIFQGKDIYNENK
jgi:hypothetical protein